MDRSQQYVSSLLERVPKTGLLNPQNQESFDRIKENLTNAPDIHDQLRTLYKVTNFSEFALGLMWIADKVERDPSKLESTTEEETFVLSLLKKAFGEMPAEAVQDAFAAPEQSFGSDFVSQMPVEEAQPQEQMPTAGTEQTLSEPGGFDTGMAVPPTPAGRTELDEQNFCGMLERLVEAVQSGSEERTSIMEDLTRAAEGIVAGENADKDYKAFCGYLIEFVRYVSTYQLFDDIRVMNLLSNIFDPFSQWTKADPSGRQGMMEQPIEMLRDFKSLFE